MFAKAVWAISRIRAMSVPEICFRAGEYCKRKIDLFFGYSIKPYDFDYGPLPHIPGFRNGLDEWYIPAELMQAWQVHAEKCANGTFTLLGTSWPPHTLNYAWHLDPLSGDLWPAKSFCFSIDYKHSAHGKDIKFAWEFNRLQYLQPIAAYAYKTDNKKWAEFCLAHIESWIDHNPPFYGINWNSGIEIALRLVSFLVILTFVGDQASPSLRMKLWSSLRTQARWIARYPSRFSSANNHATAEGLALYMIGSLCPQFSESRLWKSKGWKLLCEGAANQILPDGSGAEQSIGYTAALAETLLLGLHIARASQTTIPDFYMRRLTLAGEYLRWLCDESGHYPTIGDDDNSCVIGFFEDGYTASVLACLAALTKRADLSPPLCKPHLRQALFGFAPSCDFNPRGIRCFPYGGLTIARHESGGREVLLAFDHGPVGFLSIAAHGHADALSVWLHVDGQPIFVDAGTFRYYGKNSEREEFRGSYVHNTLTINKVSSSTSSGNFNWSRKAKSYVRHFGNEGAFGKVEAEHDGYLEEFNAIHVRSLNISPTTGVSIEDSLCCSEAHKVVLGFLLHPHLTARLEGKVIQIYNRQDLLVRLTYADQLRAVIYSPEIQNGAWYSPSFNQKVLTTKITLEGVLSPGEKICTNVYWAV